MKTSDVRYLYRRHSRWVPIVFFVLGFIFDAFMLRRIDEWLTIAQQAAYILISAGLISIELIESVREVHPPRLVGKIWKYREGLLHFLLGTLLNAYTIFYFKSASAITSFIFIIILIALLMLNEFKRFGKSQTQVHMAFLSLCLVSYLVSLAPIILGFIGDIPFVVAIVGFSILAVLYYQIMKRNIGENAGLLRTHITVPFATIGTIFTALYFAHAIPPVPLSVSYMGIYHQVRKESGEYQLTYTRSRWKFWQHGDQTFSSRPGDSVFCFVRVFSPTRFKDLLQVRWLYYDERRGWQSSDAIPMPILGGREEGYRGVTKKSNYTPGEWRVQIETRDNREIGRIHFTVESDESTDVRTEQVEIQ